MSYSARANPCGFSFKSPLIVATYRVHERLALLSTRSSENFGNTPWLLLGCGKSKGPHAHLLTLKAQALCTGHALQVASLSQSRQGDGFIAWGHTATWETPYSAPLTLETMIFCLEIWWLVRPCASHFSSDFSIYDKWALHELLRCTSQWLKCRLCRTIKSKYVF